MRPLITYGLIALMLTAIVIADGYRDGFHMTQAVAGMDRGSSPRRPLPYGYQGDIYDVDSDGPPEDSQGTAFIVDNGGVWLTAGHATSGCRRVELVVDDRRTAAVGGVMQEATRDISLIRQGLRAGAALPLSFSPPAEGSIGYHMGFPGGEPIVVSSRLIGTAGARESNGRIEPMLVWAEQWREPNIGGGLEGISGGPVLTEDGRVVGVISAVTNRRGRILTTHPDTMRNIVIKSGAVKPGAAPVMISSPRDAVSRFRGYMSSGQIRQIYCEV